MEERVLSIRELKFQSPLAHSSTLEALHKRLLEINKIIIPLMRNANQQLHLPIIANSKPYQYLYKADGKIYKGTIDPYTKAFKIKCKVKQEENKIDNFSKKILYYAYIHTNSLGAFHIRAIPVNKTTPLRYTWLETLRNETNHFNILELTVKRMYWLQIPKHYDINKKNEK
jgi:hypothetical protein